MPSAKSRRVSERRRAINAPLRNKAKTFITRARRFMDVDDLGAAEQAVKNAVVALDKASQRGALHKNNASRRKSRIMRQLDHAKKG